MVKIPAPEVRSEFAKRLKSMRVHGGFPRARYFAKALGIEENRYTRYERAEVEPSLTLINKICEVLRVSPNELLGFEQRSTPSFGFGEGDQPDLGSYDPPERQIEGLAWRLASEVAAVRTAHRSGHKDGDPLAAKRETGRLYQLLQKQPYDTTADIVADEALKGLAAERKTDLAKLMDAFTEAVSRAPSRRAG